MNPLGIRRDQLGAHIGSEQIVRDMIAAGWLKPIVSRSNVSIYAAAHVAQAFSRLMAGELPPSQNAKYKAAHKKAAKKRKEQSTK